MQLLLYISLLLACTTTLFAQAPTKSELSPCGTTEGISPWLARYAAHPEDYPESADTLYVRMKMHLLTNDNGGARITNTRLLDAFCRLNQDFADSEIRFFFDGDWNTITSSLWHSHQDLQDGIEMMLTNDVDSALNSYMVADPAGNCGYNLPYASVAVAHNCAGPNDHTWAHEIGHNLRMPHPFIGWEGKTYNANNPTPLEVTYDYTYFHDTLDTGPTPLDTALVEFLDGSNCTAAADLFCMTSPDYLSYRWQCDSDNKSNVKQIDPNGQEFYSDGTLFMSYADDACSSRFTADQTAAMRANLLSEKSDVLAAGAPIGDIAIAPLHILPTDGTIAAPNNIPLLWSSVPNATQYLVQVSRLPNFAFIEYEAVESDTTTTAFGLVDNKKYYWRVRPFNRIWTCPLYSTTSFFQTDAALDAKDLKAETWQVFPTLCAANQPVFIKTDLASSDTWQLELYDFSGKRVLFEKKMLHSGQNQVFLPDLVHGAYCLRLSDGKQVKSFSIFVR